MFCALRSKLADFVSWIFNQRASYYRPGVAAQTPDCKNPWQNNLKRLAKERPSECGRPINSTSPKPSSTSTKHQSLAKSPANPVYTSSRAKPESMGTVPISPANPGLAPNNMNAPGSKAFGPGCLADLALTSISPELRKEVSSFVSDLARAAAGITSEPAKSKRAGDGTLPNESSQPPVKRVKRTMDGTVQDIKAWYGQALVTWDPLVNDQAVDAQEQKRRAQYANRWFQ